jgi:starch synthase
MVDMKVAHLLRKYDPAEWGGTETAVLRLLSGLRQHGVAASVHAPRLARETGRDPLREAGFPVRRFDAVVPVWGISAQERQQMVAVGGNLVSFELLGTLWREPGLNVVHSHALGRLGGIGLTVARRRKIPFVVTIHGGVYDLPEKISRELNAPRTQGFEWGKLVGWAVRARQLLDEADAIFTCNPREADKIRERHPNQLVRVQPHGIDTAPYQVDRRAEARAAFPWLAGARPILVLGRIDPVKNPSWVVERMRNILEREPQATLVLAGACTDQAYGAMLQRKIEELDLEPHVRLTGGLPAGDPRLIGLIQSARVLVLPSVSETFGLVILEAWAAGTPVLASQTSGAMALIEPGLNGGLFDLARPRAFVEQLHHALGNETWRAGVIAAGRRKVQEEYDTRVVVGQVKQVYEQLIAERHPLRHSA